MCMGAVTGEWRNLRGYNDMRGAKNFEKLNMTYYYKPKVMV